MVGVSLAIALAHALPESTDILLVEGFPFPDPLPGVRPQYHPSFDARSTALSYSSRIAYQQMGVWQELEQWLCPIECIHVSSKGHFGSTLLSAVDHNWPALGYVVENTWLGNALIQSLYQQGRVEVRSPVKVTAAQPLETGVRLQLDGGSVSEIEASLLIVADGAASSLRAALGVSVEEKPYGQQALIANVATAQAHEGFAYERFTDEGPLAMLPLLSAAPSEYRSALVWALPPERAEQLAQCEEEVFLHELQQRFGYRLGRLIKAGERHTYPLSLVQSAEQIRQGVVVMGNAAHALHPVAGQGFNLALRDVDELTRVLAAASNEGRPLGDLASLQTYEQRQQGDQAKTIEFSDRVPSLFMHADPLVGLGRDLALAGLDVMPLLKQEFVRHAAGVAGMTGMEG
jgi:2-octaprenyl-6-methoxyphenol hydroxylase